MVGEDARLTRLLAGVLYVAASIADAQAPVWIVDGGCRDGQPHGRYELRTAAGNLRVAGAFNHGKRTGSFIFWTSSGARIAHIPYDDDSRNGTVATWYGTRQPAVEPPRRFESMWRRGARDGLTRTWYVDGHRRSETEYAEGRLIDTVGWTDTGARMAERAARDIAERDAAAADAEYAALEALVRSHLPNCD